ncbi:MAG: acyl-ACP--UDP-N-acetylglucosamine O-acyltransferase [Spirochaetota bacterium]|nr:acyl-ACP--UDP-N-acetylglucosamine O-acyltransferase [Spirochaetota bacterium]
MIHQTAIIENDVQIDTTVKVDAYSIIRKGVIIGANTEIGSHVEILPYTKIGKNNQIFKGAYIGGLAQDIKHQSTNNSCMLEIGDSNIIREFVTIHKGTKRISKIGNNNYLMAYSHIAHDCILNDFITLANYAGLAGWVEVDNHVFISGHTLVHQFVRIGIHSMIGGLCRISQDVPPFALIADENAKIYDINRVGLKREGWDDDKLTQLRKIYKLIFHSGLSLKTGIENAKNIELETKLITNEVNYLIQFIKDSKRGVISKWEKKKN